MADKPNYTVENIYGGGYSSMNSPSNQATAGSLGLTTDPRVANQLKEVSSKLSSGVKQIELALVTPNVFDSMPKQQLKEINRLAKLTGIDVSMHGPVIDTAGMSQQGFSELDRENSERVITETILRSHELNPEGHSPVTFHSADGIPGTQWEITPEGKKAKKIVAVDRETGKMVPLEPETLHYLGTEKLEEGKFLTPEKRLDSVNNTQWINSLTEIETHKKQADELMRGALAPLAPILEDMQNGEKPEIKTPEQQSAWRQIQRADVFLQNVETSFNSLFDKAYKYSDEKTKEQLKQISDHWRKELGKKEKKLNPLNYPIIKSQLLDNAMMQIKEIYNHTQSPQIYVPIEKFATEQSSKTFGNAAFNAYKKFGDKAPIVSIENPPAGFALSTGEDLKNLVVESRKQFVERAVKEGLNEKDAERQAEKLIGATWDVGHINMLRKSGFEDKDILKETEAIAPYVKHVHLSDNFGFEHTELPMGMGNVPIKEIMEKLGKQGFEAKKIIEAGHWWQHFQTPPVRETMEAMGSPIYSDGVGPYWSQSLGLYENYATGMGMMLPSGHFRTYGIPSFSQLPTELGGQMQGQGGSRMSGNPME